MQQEADIEKRVTKKDKPQATVILRVDKETRFEKTYAIMRACRTKSTSSAAVICRSG